MLPLSYYFQHPDSLVISLIQRFGGWIPDKVYLKLLYRMKMGHKLDLEHPKTFTEKLQWLKLYDRKPEYTQMVDKYAVKDYVAGIIGKEYIIPTFGVWDKPESIDWDILPKQFVLKTTHGGGGSGVVICQDKNSLDRNTTINKLRKSMNQDIYTSLREWPYKNVPHRIIAEKLLEIDPVTKDVPDYKFYCFNGIPKVLLIATNRFTKHNFDYYDMSFNRLPITSNVGDNSPIQHNKPKRFEEMCCVVQKLCDGFAHVRVDLYYSNDKVYFGELTLYDSSGFDNLSSDIVDNEWGDWIKLP